MQLLVGDTGCFSQVVSAEVVAELEVENREVVGFEASSGVIHQSDELGGLEGPRGRPAGMFEGVTEAHGITGAGFGAAAGEGVTLVASHGKEPRPDPFGLTELGQSRRRPEEYLVGDVGGIIRRTGEAGAEVEQLHPEPVVKLPERVPVPLGCKRCHFGISCESEGPSHEGQAYETKGQGERRRRTRRRLDFRQNGPATLVVSATSVDQPTFLFVARRRLDFLATFLAFFTTFLATG